MQQKLTITIDDEVYQGLKKHIGQGKIAKFLENLARPFVTHNYLAEAYQQMSLDEAREQEADEWVQAFSSQMDDDAW